MTSQTLTGGCLCGQVRYEARGAPQFAGLCYCGDCRKASGSGFMPFMGFAAEDVDFQGETFQSRVRAFRGGEAVRNHCAHCGGLVFGGIVGEDTSHTVYAGSLDAPTAFEPKIAIFTRERPAWAALPPGLTAFETMPQ